MSIRQQLSRDRSEWNHPRRARYGPPLLAGLGGAAGTVLGYNTQLDPAIGAGLVAMIGALVGWFVVAAMD